MASLNKVLILGNLGADPDFRMTQGGQAVAELRVATTEVFKPAGGDRTERTEWHRVVVWGRQAEHCHAYLKKGRTVFVEGRLQTRQWEDKQGQKRYTTEIVASNVQFIGAPTGSRGTEEGPVVEPLPAPADAGPVAIGDDDVPF
ncbi:MAG TPA: single-stranded DNA-binding protein [Myxococcota bacterium]|nr:single-stranded DNA-binding protein [Myxococcota bacterium]HQK49771.1 single-stranded DNA-binding protein [Myxococcota bacterium]